MILFLQPNDTFFFRDGRPFTKGEQSEGHSIFPPLPSTILGALRTLYIAEHGDLASFYAGAMAQTIGTPNSLGSMQLKGVFLADKRDIFFPIPLDLVTKKKENEKKLYRLTLRPADPNGRSNASLIHRLQWVGPEDVASETDGKFWPIDLHEYLLGRQNEFMFRKQECFVHDEPKIGIERNRQTFTSAEGMLYRIRMSRFRNLNNKRSALSEFGFVVDYHCEEALPAKGMLKLGGEGKSFRYEQSQHNPNPYSTEDMAILKVAIQQASAFKLYFATPAIFKQGWLPAWLDDKTLCGRYPLSRTASLPLELITAAVGKPTTIGGWDMAQGKAKPTYRAVPAGSVYYFKIPDDSCVDDVMQTFHNQNISDYQAQEGYGLCFVGAAPGGTT